MNRDRDNKRSQRGWLVVTLASGAFALAISGAAFANSGGGGGGGGKAHHRASSGCSGCGAKSRSHVSPRRMRLRAQRAAEASLDPPWVTVAVRFGGRPSEDLAGAIAPLGETEARNALEE